ncbi:MAG: trigger factor [Treponema sp.]|nr:trigger factor [Treponema sp.]
MVISKDIVRLEHSSVKLTLTVGKEEVRSQYNEMLAGYTKSLQIPGFRKGKAPREVLERKFGSALKDEALGRIIEKTITGLFEDENFPKEDRPLPYSTPQVQDEPVLDFDADLTFSVVYDTLPQFTVKTWKGLEVEVPQAAVSNGDINRELETIRDRNAIVMDKDESAAAAAGDVVTVNYLELSGTGEPLPGTEREDFVFTLGTGYNTFKFDDEMTGMKKGEIRDIEKSYPADFEDKDLAGKTKKIRITLSALKEKKLPGLDDDLAQDVDEKYKTLEDLKNSIRERLTRNLEKRIRDITVSKILEKVMENTPVEAPESMIRIELESRWRNLARRFNTSPEELVKIMDKSGQGYEAITAEWRPDAVRALHSRLIVETLMKDLALEASDEDAEQALENMAAESNSPLEDIKKYYQQENMKEYLKEEIKERKLFDILIKENTVKPGKKVNYLDLAANNG